MDRTTLAMAGLLAIVAAGPGCDGREDPGDAAADAAGPSDAGAPADAAASGAGQEASDASTSDAAPSVVSTAVF